MKQTTLLLFIFTAFAFSIRKDKIDFKEMYVFEGLWKMETKRGALYESWKKVDNKYLQSNSFMVKANKDTVFMESVALKKSEQGIFYNSTVKNQNNGKAIAFQLTSANNKVFVFENKLHDFPKRIVYDFSVKDSLHAWIDGGENEKQKRSDFYYKRQ